MRIEIIGVDKIWTVGTEKMKALCHEKCHLWLPDDQHWKDEQWGVYVCKMEGHRSTMKGTEKTQDRWSLSGKSHLASALSAEARLTRGVRLGGVSGASD